MRSWRNVTISVLVTAVLALALAVEPQRATSQVASGPEGPGPSEPPPNPDDDPPPPPVCDYYVFKTEESVGLSATGQHSTNDIVNSTFDPGPFDRRSYDPLHLFQVTSGIPDAVKTRLENFFNANINSVLNDYNNIGPSNADRDRRDGADDRFIWLLFAAVYESGCTACFMPAVSTGRNIWLPPYTSGPQTKMEPTTQVVTNYSDGRTVFFVTFYLDKLGNFVSAVPSSATVCDAGAMYVLNSPISLIWNGKEPLSSTFTQFPINPGKQGEHFLWKASAGAPLLVWDPEHKGHITSGTELFGNWTFGGKKTASIASAVGVTAKPWTNGYEALGSLDSDMDGEISGEELAPLGLWFDRNRNGISEAGEVIDLRKTGVTRLFYKITGSQQPGQDISLERGFERMRDGKLEIGESVDWYSASDREPSSLLGHLYEPLVRSARSPTSIEETLREVAPLDGAGSVGSSPNDAALRRELAGIWRWSLEQSDGKSTQVGYFAFGADDEARLTGVAVNAFRVPWAPGFTSLQITSTFVKAKGPRDGTFLLMTPGSGRVESSFVVSDDGKKLRGSSRGTFPLAGSATSISYAWVADKLSGDGRTLMTEAMKAGYEANRTRRTIAKTADVR